VLRVADLADGRITISIHLADFTRRQTNLRVTFVARHQRRRAARRTHHLAATTRRQFDIMDRDADRNGLERKRIGRFQEEPPDRWKWFHPL